MTSVCAGVLVIDSVDLLSGLVMFWKQRSMRDMSRYFDERIRSSKAIAYRYVHSREGSSVR